MVRAAATFGYIGLATVVCAVVVVGESPGHDDAWILGAVAAVPAFCASGAYGLAENWGVNLRNRTLVYLLVISALATGIVGFPYIGEEAELEAFDFMLVFGAVAFGAGVLAMTTQRVIHRGFSGKLGCVAAMAFLLGFFAFGI